MRFTDENGKWIDFTPDFPSNHRGTYKECGEWAVPVFPSNISLVGSVPTPYIYDDRCAPEEVATATPKATPSPSPSTADMAGVEPSSSPSPKKSVAPKKTITCVKGGRTIKVTGKDPKCPTGFTIKK